MNLHPRSKKSGFTLLEMSIVLAIIAIVGISIVTVFAASLQKAQYQQTISKMEVIQKALTQYRIANNRLPCPADATIPINTQYFGIESINPGDCTTGSTYNATGVRTAAAAPGPTANYIQSPVFGAALAQAAREGMVPTKTLQLPDDYAFDGWGRRFMYAVCRDMTQNGAVTFITAYDTSPRMTVWNAQGVAKSTSAMEVLISFGPNGHGAYPRNGGTVRVNASSDNAAEWNNCDCDGGANATGFDGVFVQKDATLDPNDKLDGFDDILYFATRADYLLSSSLVQPPFNLNAGSASAAGDVGGIVGGSPGLSGGGYCPNGGQPSCKITAGIKKCQCAL